VPAELDHIISQLLRKEPRERIPTALALSNRLKAMQHALTRDDKGGSPDAPDQHAADHLRLEDQATRAVEIERGPPTEVSPTIVDSTSSDSPQQDHAGNEATVVTSRVGDLDPDRASAPTVADKTPPRTSRFTPLDEAERRLADEERRRGAFRGHLHTAGLAAAFLGVVAAIVWAVWPPSADTLYHRLTTISREQGPR
jgi:serine/threonine-protein kinase